MGRVLGIVYHCIATHLVRKAGFACNNSLEWRGFCLARFYEYLRRIAKNQTRMTPAKRNEGTQLAMTAAGIVASARQNTCQWTVG
jgi:hypothetical protein